MCQSSKELDFNDSIAVSQHCRGTSDLHFTGPDSQWRSAFNLAIAMTRKQTDCSNPQMSVVEIFNGILNCSEI
jgi:hypothetical protein